MSSCPERNSQIRSKIKIVLDFSSHGPKSGVEKGRVADTSEFA